MEHGFIIVEEVLIPLDEIKYARYQIEPGTLGTSGQDEVLCVFWKHGGHVTIPGQSMDDFAGHLHGA